VYIEERVVGLANFIIEKKTTVRAAAKKFGISKSTVHTVVTKWKEICLFSSALIEEGKGL
jgi:putative DeoR family transcriptional regulator, stage III sporulation protein D